MATRYFHADNCLRAFKVPGKELVFKPYTNAGSWRGTYTTSIEDEANALADLAKDSKLALREITESDYNRLIGGAPPLMQYEPIRVSEATAQKIAAQNMLGKSVVELTSMDLPAQDAPKVAIEDALATAPVETHAMTQDAPKRKGGRPSKTKVSVSPPDAPPTQE